MGIYHPFDGDGMLHAVYFEMEQCVIAIAWSVPPAFWPSSCGQIPMAGITEPDKASRRGWGSIGAMKDNAGTDVVAHVGDCLPAWDRAAKLAH